MFPIRAVGHLRGPSAEQVTEYAAKHGLRLTPEEAERMAAGVTTSLLAMDRVDELDAPAIELRHTDRDPGRAPRGGEDPFNAVVRFCEVKGAEEGPLAGRTVGVKDCIAVAGVPTTDGGRRMPLPVPTEDAVVVERLLDAGATITMKCNMEDLALGLGEGSQYGAARNPVDPRFSTGGSSSGSGAAVAAGMCDMALGADEGGSVRIPASWCGLVGMKATHGLVPSYGMTYMDHTLDHIGPITKTVADNALMLEAIAGYDWRDPQWMRAAPSAANYSEAKADDLKGLKIGIIDESLAPVGCSDDVLEAFEGAKEKLVGLGATIESVSVPLWPDSMAIAMGIITFGLHAMVTSGGQGIGHLGRVDVEKLATNVAQFRLGTAELPPMLKNSMITAEYLRDAYLGVHFGRAQNLRLELRRQVEEALSGVDVLIMPTMTKVAFELLDGRAEPGVMEERTGTDFVGNTAPLDLTGHPALTVPCGLGEHGLPVGLQIVGAHLDEYRLYEVGSAFEAVAGFESPAQQVAALEAAVSAGAAA
jgi:amidase